MSTRVSRKRKVRSRVGLALLALNLQLKSEFTVAAKDAMAARLFALRHLKFVVKGQRDWNDPSKVRFIVDRKTKR
ncbi:MAG TPA: hypothetical protein VGN17_05055 [Bryobacteraceae bacterium]|jgi:hypothetical protein